MSGSVTLNFYSFPDNSGAVQQAVTDCTKASGGSSEFYGIQARLAICERWSLVISELGLVSLQPHNSDVGLSDKTGFAEPPGTRLVDNSISRWSNIGGQPFVLTTWNSDDVIKEGLDIVKWWLSKPVQVKFVKSGGQSGMLSVMDDPAYATWAPYNRAYLDNYQWQKDVWHIPEFFPLLTEQQEQVDKAVTGQVTAKQALDTVAAFQDKLLREAGRIK